MSIQTPTLPERRKKRRSKTLRYVSQIFPYIHFPTLEVPVGRLLFSVTEECSVEIGLTEAETPPRDKAKEEVAGYLTRESARIGSASTLGYKIS
jgi:hypothetical protein